MQSVGEDNRHVGREDSSRVVGVDSRDVEHEDGQSVSSDGKLLHSRYGSSALRRA